MIFVIKMNKMKVEEINKEEIRHLNFSFNRRSYTNDIALYRLLKEAEKLGNGFKQKSKIFFTSKEGSFVVATTIWFACESFVQLKGGVLIPTASVYQVIPGSL